MITMNVSASSKGSFVLYDFLTKWGRQYLKESCEKKNSISWLKLSFKSQLRAVGDGDGL